LDDLPVAAFSVDRAGRLVHHNAAFRKLLGQSSPAAARLESWIGAALRASSPAPSDDLELVNAEGEHVHVRAFARSLASEPGGGGCVVVLFDVTDRQRRESEDRLLAHASRLLSSSFDIERTLSELAVAVASVITERCAVYLDGASGMRALGVALREPGAPSRAAWWPAPLDEPPRTAERSLVEDVHRFGTPLSRDSQIAVPLLGRDSVLGVLLLREAAGRSDREHEVAVAVRIAERAASAIERARLFRDAQQRAVAEEALRRAAAAVSSAYTIQEVIAQVADRAIEAIGADGAFVERIDLARGEVELVAASGIWRPDTGTRLPYDGSLAQEVIERKRPILIEHGQHVDSVLLRQMRQAHGPSAILVVPLRNAGEPIGCLILVRSKARAGFHPDEASRAKAFGELAALAFRKIHLLEESERRRSDLERVTESRNELIRGFSHDLKNPLGAADGYLALLSDTLSAGLDQQQRSFIARARGQLKAALDLIEDLGQLHRAQAGYVPLQLTPVELIDLVGELVDAYTPQAELKGLELLLEHPESVPLISSDPNRLRQVLGNLLSNALKYTEAGRVRVAIGEWRSPDDEPFDWLTVSVEDTGPGIAADKQRLIFKEFARISPQGQGGAGLGLAISQRIAEALGGEITVESAEGLGSTFTLWLPITGEGAAAEPRSPSQPQ
jgi:signal transduction histidine kinase